VEAPLEPAADEVTRLRRCLNDLLSVMALPDLWTDGEPHRIVAALLDALIGMLELDLLLLVLVPLNDSEGGPSIEMVRVADSLPGTGRPGELSGAIASSLGEAPLKWPARARLVISGVDLSVATARLGVQGDIGVVLAGCQRRDFPVETERFLLDVAANQAAIGLHHGRLLREQKRLTSDLHQRVTQRTSELAVANAQLKKEVAERRRVEAALRETERESRVIVDSIPGFIATLTPAGELEFVNRPSLEYFGRTLEELRGWATGGMAHPEDLPRAVEIFTDAMASGNPFEFEVRARRFDGVYRWFQSRGFPLRDSEGHVVRWYHLLIDIEDQKRAEEALRQSERHFRLLVETIPALVWRGTPEGELDYLNQRAIDYLGYTAESLSGGRWLELVHPDHRDATARRWLHSATTGASYEDVYRLRRADDEYRWIQSVGAPLRDTDGRIAHWYGLVIDIEERKRAEIELRRAYDSFADAQRLSKTGSFITDLVGDDHNWSEEAYRIFEFEPGTKVSVQKIRDMIHPDDVPSFESVIMRGMTGENVTFAFRILTGRGAVKHVRGVAHVVERVAGRPLFVGALQDVTESKAAEEALDRARSELAHVARITTLSTLTASIAHEVNQPLSGIITNAGTCLRMLDADPPNVEGARETARRTIRDGNRASEVVTRLRALFKKKEFTLEPLDLNEATREVIALMASDLQRERVIVQSELADDLPWITGDRVQLQQVILNLVRNASDAMANVHDHPRQLLIRTVRDDGDWVRLSVRDAGVGLDRQNMNNLFDAFYTTKTEGMGIGLSISRSIIERHHGRLWAEPNEGPGVTFTFSIPRSQSVSVTPDAL
jgi:PAS domain S-box-containing protein